MLHAAEVSNFPSIPFGQVEENLGVGKHSSNRMVIVQSVEGLTANFLTERKVEGLTSAVNATF